MKIKLLVYCVVFSCLLMVSGGAMHGQNALSDIAGAHAGRVRAFIENKGQIHDQWHRPMGQVRYLLPSDNINVVLSETGFSYDTYSSKRRVAGRDSLLLPRYDLQAAPNDTFSFHRIDMEFVGGNPHPQIEAMEPLTEYLNYYNVLGVFEHVGQYRQVTYYEVWPLIDVVFKTGLADGAFEYDFVLHPGAKMEDIVLRVSGPESVLLTASRIDMQLSGYTLNERIPLSYWQEDGVRESVHYRLESGSGWWLVGFEGAQGLIDRTLIIDPTPTIQWGTYLGGSSYEWLGFIDTDNSNNVIVGGFTESPNAIATFGAYQTTYYGNRDVYFAKYSPTGTRLWGTYLGHLQNDELWGGLVADRVGNIYVAGRTSSPAGFSTVGAHQSVLGGGQDGFVAKFTGSGSRIWSTYFGGPGHDDIQDAVLDQSNRLWVAGGTFSTSAITTPNANQGVLNGVSDVLVAQFDSAGTHLYGSYYGGEGVEFGRFMDLDSNNNLVLVGVTQSATGMTTVGCAQSNLSGVNSEMFIVKFDSNHTRIWGTYWGGIGEELPGGICFDRAGNVILSAMTETTTGLTTPGSHQPVFAGGVRDVLLTKFDPGGAVVWSTYMGGSGGDEAQAVVTDSLNNILIGGYTLSSNNIATANGNQTTLQNGLDGYLVQFTPGGTRLWGSYYGGNASDYVSDLAVDRSGNYVAIGHTNSTSGIATPGAAQPTMGGINDVFVCKFNYCLAPDSVHFVVSQDTVCAGTAYTLSVNGVALNSATNWYWYAGNCGGTLIDSGAVVTVVPQASTVYSVRAEGGCIVNASCESLAMTVHAVSQDTLPMVALCAGEWAVVFGNLVQTAGVYSDTLQSIYGCDSVLVQEVEVTPVDTSITLNGSTLMSGATASSYQWLDCDLGWVSIPGATGSSFLPQASGNFAVAVTQNGCVDTSACVSVIVQGAEGHLTEGRLVLYPNPTDGIVRLVYPAEVAEVSIMVYNTMGQMVMELECMDSAPKVLDLSHLAMGTYHVLVHDGEEYRHARVVLGR